MEKKAEEAKIRARSDAGVDPSVQDQPQQTSRTAKGRHSMTNETSRIRNQRELRAHHPVHRILEDCAYPGLMAVEDAGIRGLVGHTKKPACRLPFKGAIKMFLTPSADTPLDQGSIEVNSTMGYLRFQSTSMRSSNVSVPLPLVVLGTCTLLLSLSVHLFAILSGQSRFYQFSAGR